LSCWISWTFFFCSSGKDVAHGFWEMLEGVVVLEDVLDVGVEA